MHRRTLTVGSANEEAEMVMESKLEREIFRKILELVNEGKTVIFSEDWGENSITVAVEGAHWHCGTPEGSFQQMIEELHRLVVVDGGPKLG